jgi:uncharacterized damage-inducible protein DinB
MELKEFFLKQLDYNERMNMIMLDKLKELGHPPHEAVSLLSHITKAQIVWLDRLYGTGNIDRKFFDVLSFPEMEDKLKDNHRGWVSFMNEVGEEGLNNTYAYKNSRGEAYEDSLYDILFHVINHSTHHRAQISKILRQHDIAPPVMDYIAYLRK